MSGHSKWANIKHRKMAVDSRKACQYAQLSKEISVAAKLGGSDPVFNFRLRNAIERAKIVGMPSDNIQRAIEKHISGAGSNFEEILYEGYGPQGIAVLVEAATNNRNRTAAELRSIFGKYGGNLGESGCVNWGFRHLAIISFQCSIPEDELLEYSMTKEIDLLDYGQIEEEFYATCQIPDLERALSCFQIKYQCSGEIVYLPDTELEILDLEVQQKLEKMLDSLENNEDVQKVFHNAAITHPLL